MNRLRPEISFWVAAAQNRGDHCASNETVVATVIERSFYLHPLQDIPAATNLGLSQSLVECMLVMSL